MIRILRALDWLLLAGLLCLAALGMLVLYAAVHQGDTDLWYKQAAYWATGMAVFLTLCFMPLRVLGLACWPMYGAVLLLLILVPLFGDVHMGARRWLDLGIANIQPSEIMKWTLVFVLASWFSSRESRGSVEIIIPLLLAAIPAGLIVIQPDLGTTLVLLFATTAMIIAA